MSHFIKNKLISQGIAENNLEFIQEEKKASEGFKADD